MALPKNRTKEEQVQRIAKGMKCSYEEAEEIYMVDFTIDKGADPFPQTAEQKKATKKYSQADRVKATSKPQEEEKRGKNPTAYKWDTADKKRKENPTKSAIISEIANFLVQNSENACENVEITNKERQIAFRIGNNDYEFTLVQKRKPKK